MTAGRAAERRAERPRRPRLQPPPVERSEEAAPDEGAGRPAALVPAPGPAGGARLGRAEPPGALGVVNAWSETMDRLTALNMRFFGEWLKLVRPRGARHLDALAFGQIGRLASTRWLDQVRRVEEDGAGEQGSNGGSERLRGMMRGMATEYSRDIAALPPDAFVVDVEPLARAWTKANSESIDDEAVRVVERFLAVMAVKARYGPEYYADPVLTEVGRSPRQVVHEVEGATLYRYERPEGVPPRDAPPVLLVYSVINKPFILDLIPGYSFVEHLVGQGLEVYLVEWGPTRPGDRTTTLDSYVDPVIHGCVRAIRALTGAGRVTLFGHCIGGVLAAIYAAQYPAEVDRLVVLTAPFSSPPGGVVGMWTDPTVFPLEEILESYGHVPAKLIRHTFIGLKPYYELVKWKTFLENLDNDEALRLFYPVDRWANDNVDIPGEVFRKFVVEVYHEERLRRGLTTINGRRVDLGEITCPLMNLLATADWIVPPASAEILNDLVGSRDRRLVRIEGAHVAIMIDPRTRPVWTQMSEFMAEKTGPTSSL